MKTFGITLLGMLLVGLATVLFFEAFPDFRLFNSESLTVGIVAASIVLLMDAIKYGIQKIQLRTSGK